MGFEDPNKKLDNSQKVLEHSNDEPLAADAVISDLIRDIWGNEPAQPEAPAKDPVKVIPVRSADGILQIKTDRPDTEIFTPDVLRFVNRTLSSRADDPNLKQIVYMAIVSKYGQKKGLAIYRQIKDFVEE